MAGVLLGIILAVVVGVLIAKRCHKEGNDCFGFMFAKEGTIII